MSTSLVSCNRVTFGFKWVLSLATFFWRPPRRRRAKLAYQTQSTQEREKGGGEEAEQWRREAPLQVQLVAPLSLSSSRRGLREENLSRPTRRRLHSVSEAAATTMQCWLAGKKLKETTETSTEEGMRDTKNETFRKPRKIKHSSGKMTRR